MGENRASEQTATQKIIMKNKKFVGFIVAASLAVGTTATFAQNQSADQPAQDQQSQAGQAPSQAGQDQQSGQSQIQKDTQAQPGAVLDEPAGASNFDKEKFIKETAEGNTAEINVAQLATQKAQDPQIKEFAQKLVTDHSKVGDELKQLAQKEGITLSTEVEPKKQKVMDHLSGLSGAEFDKAFTSHMARDHQKDVAMFKKAASSDDAAIREFAQNTLPTLQEHLRTVQQWAPEAAAGTELQEPAGAEKKPDDANKPDQQNQDQQNQQQNQDQNNQDQNQTPSPDSAGQALPK